MIYSKKGIMQLIVMDFAQKYLNVKDPLDIEEIITDWRNTFPKIIKNEIYNIDDVKYCISELGSVLEKDFFDESKYFLGKIGDSDGTKVLIEQSVDDRSFIFRLFDIINSFPNSDNNRTSYEIRKCLGCGKYFRGTSQQNYCDHKGITGDTCEEISHKPVNHQSDLIYEYQDRLNHKTMKYNGGLITKEELESWQKEGIEKLIKCNMGEISTSEFIKWLSETL